MRLIFKQVFGSSDEEKINLEKENRRRQFCERMRIILYSVFYSSMSECGLFYIFVFDSFMSECEIFYISVFGSLSFYETLMSTLRKN